MIMKPETDLTRRPARLVYAAVLVLVTLLISVVFIKHFDGQSEESAQASTGADLTHSKAARGPAAAAASAASSASSASAASAASAEPPNPFKAFLENGKAAAPVPKSAPAAAPASAASQPADPFKAFLESNPGAASSAQPPAVAPKPQDSQDSGAADPFKEALERQQQQQQQQH
jgi:hypothetical protein